MMTSLTLHRGGQPDSMSLQWVIRLLLLAAATIISCYVFVAPGHPLTVDAWPHLSRTKMVYEALRDGHSPFWSFVFYSGYPALRFYSPLFYVVGGTLALVTGGNILLALRILLVALQVLSVCAMFLLIRRRTGDLQAASFGALIYIIVPWRAHHLGGYANYPQAMIYLWLPLVVFCLDRLMARPNRRVALLFGLVIAVGVLSHIIYAAAGVALGLVLLLGYPWSTAGGGAGHHDRLVRRRLSALGIAASVALGVSAFFLVPLLAEYQGRVFPSAAAVYPTPDQQAVLNLLLGQRGRPGYFGLSVLVLLLLAVVTLAHRRRYALAVTLCLVVSLLHVFWFPRFPVLGSLPTLQLPPERFLVYSLFFAAFLIGLAWPAWRGRVLFMRRFPLVASVTLVGIVLLDCVGWNLVNYNLPKERFLASRPSVYLRVATRDHSRILDLATLRGATDNFMRIAAFPAMGYMFGDLATPLGPPYHQFAPRCMLYCYPWINAVSGDLGDTIAPAVTVPTKTALALMGVSHVLMYPKVLQDVSGPDSLSPRLLLKDGFRWDARFVVPGKRPYLVSGASGFGIALASTRTRTMRPESVIGLRTVPIADDWQAVLDSVSVDDTLGVLSFIPVTARDRAESLPGSPMLQVDSTSIRNQDVTVRITASCDCFLRLAVSYYPELRVTVDGEPVEFRETKDHFIWLRCPEGVHTVGVTAPLTPLRRWTLLISALVAVVVVAGIVLPERRRT